MAQAAKRVIYVIRLLHRTTLHDYHTWHTYPTDVSLAQDPSGSVRTRQIDEVRPGGSSSELVRLK